MAYARELDSLRQELRLSTAGTIIHWARVDGINVQVSATAGHCTFEVFDPTGRSLQGPTNIDGTLVVDVDRFDIAVSAISALDEDYYVDILWRQASSSVTRRDVVYFDVVRYPWGQPLIGLNDLLEERPDIGEILDRHGQMLGYSAGDAAKTTAAGIYAAKAHVELDALIRAQVASESSTIGSIGAGYPLIVRTRPNLILNRERLRRVESKIAMREIYAADNRGSEDEGSWLYRHYAEMAAAAWSSIGPLKYGATETLVPDTIVDNLGTVVRQRRAQG